MVLSTPLAGSTPSDASSSEALDLHPRFEGETSGIQSDTAVLDTTLLLENSFLSAATDSDLGHPPITTTSTERSHVVRLHEEPHVSKSLDVLDSAFDSSLAGIDLGELTSLTAGGVFHSEIDPEILESVRGLAFITPFFGI